MRVAGDGGSAGFFRVKCVLFVVVCSLFFEVGVMSGLGLVVLGYWVLRVTPGISSKSVSKLNISSVPCSFMTM